MDANTLGYVMAVLTIGISWISMRSSFFGLKLMAGMWWIVVFMYMKEMGPVAIIEGSGLHISLLLVCIGIGLMIVLSGLGRGIQRTEKWNEKGFSQTSEGFHFKLPDWLKEEDNSPEQRTRNTNAELNDYRETLRRAYRRKGQK